MTLEEFLQLREKKPALEYVDGVISRKVSPKLRHGLLQTALAERINAAARRRKGAMAVTEVRTTFGGRSTVPDVSVFRRERIPRESNGEPSDDVFIPPDITIEIVSPRQSVTTLRSRCRWFVSNGVEIALLVDPADRSVVAFFADASMLEWHGSDRIDLRGVVPDLDLTVEHLFRVLTE
jgi:Uma2 family endonuclease